MSEEKKKEGEGEGGEGAPKKSKKLLFIIIGVVLLLGGGGGAFMMMKGKPAEGEEKKQEELPPHLVVTDMGNFIVNLSEPTKFVKLRLLLEYDANALERAVAALHGGGEAHGGGGSGGEEGGGSSGLPGPVKERDPMVKDAIIKVLSAKKADEVLKPAGKDQLKDELIEAVNDALGLEEPVVVAVYFTEFIVQ